MKKTILLLLLATTLTACEAVVIQTQEEKLQIKKDCAGLWYKTFLDADNNASCSRGRIEDKVMKCIKEYTNWLDEKYNNPDIITNLREDDYSNVVKACSDVFWEIIAN